MANPTRFTSGVSTAAVSTTLGSLPEPDPTKVVRYFNDFFVYAAGDWTVTGSPTNALLDITGGALQMTAANTTNGTVSQIQQSKKAFTVQSGKKAWFKTRVKLADQTNGDMLVGWYVADATPIASLPSDGMFFRKSTGAASVDFVVNVGSSSVTAALALTTMAADTFITLGFYYDGSTTVYVYVNDVLTGSYTLASSTLTSFASLTFAPAFAQQNTNNSTATVGTIDYLLACCER